LTPTRAVSPEAAATARWQKNPRPSFVARGINRYVAREARLTRGPLSPLRMRSLIGVRQSDSTFVYAREDGEPMQPRSLTHAWLKMLRRTNLPRIRFHDLRHAHATHLLSNGVHPKVASERLGHSRVGITLDLYSHVLPGMQEDAAARVDDALREALQKRAPSGVR
jgi:integrase